MEVEICELKMDTELIEVTYFLNPHTFWINRITKNCQEYQLFDSKLQKYAKNAAVCVPKIGEVFAVLDIQRGKWIRAKIELELSDETVECLERSQIPSSPFRIWLVDQGRPVEIKALPRRLHREFRDWEPKVERAALYGVSPATVEFNPERNILQKCPALDWSPNVTNVLSDLMCREQTTTWFKTRSTIERIVIGDLFIVKDQSSVNVAEYLCHKGITFIDELHFLEGINKHLSICPSDIIHNPYGINFSTISHEGTNSSRQYNTPDVEDISQFINFNVFGEIKKPRLFDDRQFVTSNMENISPQTSTGTIPKIRKPKTLNAQPIYDNKYGERPISISRGKSIPNAAVITAKTSPSDSPSTQAVVTKDTMTEIQQVSKRPAGRGIRRRSSEFGKQNPIVDKVHRTANIIEETINMHADFSPAAYNKSVVNVPSENTTLNISPKKIVIEEVIVTKPFEDDAEFLERMKRKQNRKMQISTPKEYSNLEIKDYNISSNTELPLSSGGIVTIQNKCGNETVSINTKNRNSNGESNTSISQLFSKMKKPRKSPSLKGVSHNKDDSCNNSTSDNGSSTDSTTENSFQNLSGLNEIQRKTLIIMKTADDPTHIISAKSKATQHNVSANETPDLSSPSQQVVGSAKDDSDFDFIERKINIHQRGRHIIQETAQSLRLAESVKDTSVPCLLVHSLKKIKPVANIADAFLNSAILRALDYISFSHLKTIEKYAWSALNRGENIVTIALKNADIETACMTYLPILCNTLITGDYAELGPPIGPCAIILCASATAARSINKKLYSLLFYLNNKNNRNVENAISKPRVFLQLNHPTPMNGCDLLITTPKRYLHFMQGKNPGMELKRLSHVVLEEADLMSELYSAELDTFFQYCQDMLEFRRNVRRNVQLIMTGERWTNGIEKLCKATPVRPTICIKAHIEAAIYARATIRVQFVEGKNKITVLNDLITSRYHIQKTLIMCNNDKEVQAIADVLNSNGVNVLAITRNSKGTDVRSDCSSWNLARPGSIPLLILCDDTLADVPITSTTWLIHYSLPRTWTHFSYRFFTLTDSYTYPFTTNQNAVLSSKIFIFIDEKNQHVIPRMVNFLQRMNIKIDPILMDIYQKEIYQREVIKAKLGIQMCHSLLSRGECANGFNCKGRHKLFDTDQPKLKVMIGSELKLRLFEFHDTTFFSARIFDTLEDNYAMIAMDMTEYYREHDYIASEIQIGKLYSYKSNSLYQRCQILNIRQNNIVILLIDCGEIVRCTRTDLFDLPANFTEIPPQAIQVYIAGLKPYDGETVWDSYGKTFITALLTKLDVKNPRNYLVGVVKLVINRTVWLDNVHLREYFMDSKTTVDKSNLSYELLREKLAEKNSAHIPALAKLCQQSNIVMDVLSPPKNKPLVKKCVLQKAHMDITNTFEKVYLLATDGQVQFYLGLQKYSSILENLINDIALKVAEPFYPTHVELIVGTYCLAYTEKWKIYCRAIIRECSNDDIKCFLLDEGYDEFFTADMLRPIMPWMLSKLPSQSITCRLHGVKCNVDEYLFTYEGNNNLWAKCVERDVNGVHSILLMCKSKLATEFINLLILKNEGAIATPHISEEDFSYTSEPEDIEDYDEDVDNSADIIETIQTEGVRNRFLSEDELKDNESADNVYESSIDNFDIEIEDFEGFYQDLTKNQTRPVQPSPAITGSPPNAQLENISKCERKIKKNSHLSPTVLWHQTVNQIVLKIQLIGIIDYEVKATTNSLYFSTIYEHKRYVLDLNLYEAIHAENIYHEAKGLEIIVKLPKFHSEINWPRLLKTKQKVRHIRVNLDREISDDEAENLNANKMLTTLGKAEFSDDSDESLVDYDFGSDSNSSSDMSSLSDEDR